MTKPKVKKPKGIKGGNKNGKKAKAVADLLPTKKVFKNIDLHLDQKVKIRLDAKTEIYLRKDQNNPKEIARIKAKFNIL